MTHIVRLLEQAEVAMHRGQSCEDRGDLYNAARWFRNAARYYGLAGLGTASVEAAHRRDKALDLQPDPSYSV